MNTSTQSQGLLLDESVLEDMARIAFGDAMTSGVSVDAFMRLALAVAQRATAAAQPQSEVDCRERFEEALMAEHGLEPTWNVGRKSYDQFPAHLALWAWRHPKAVRPVVVLPAKKASTVWESTNNAHNNTLVECATALKQQGLQVQFAARKQGDGR